MWSMTRPGVPTTTCAPRRRPASCGPYGEPPYSYLMTRRIERAMALLRRGDLSVTEVCFEVGCSSLGTFSSRFTELVGMPPSTYREEAAREAAGIPSCLAKQVTRPVRNREAPVAARH